ncbi:potassium channel family protein [Nocardioides sp. LHG3406-4]|uniref:potassium channel family protein n=1 Tax=Nocardioides sp. LHG3406-4 TaxID=2804575 RepID=UPI003CF2FC11
MTRRSAARWRPAWCFAGLLVAYYAFPLEWSGSTGAIAISLVLTALGLALLGRMMVLELQHLRAGIAGRAAGALTIMLVLLIMSFSLAFYLVDLLAPEQISGLSTRTDALYFTLSTMTTVGYGDVHAEGQLARALVCGLIVFNIVVVASLVRAHTRLGQPPV